MEFMIGRAMVVVGAVALAFGIDAAAHSALAGDRCVYDGTPYSDGAFSCQGGVQFKCDDGDWKSKHQPCSQPRVIEKRKTERRDTIEVPAPSREDEED
jgi:hypothetical protein